MNASIKEDFYNQIEAELNSCDPIENPIICSNLDNPQSKNSLIETIAATVMSEKITISKAIAQTEQLYSLNDID